MKKRIYTESQKLRKRIYMREWQRKKAAELKELNEGKPRKFRGPNKLPTLTVGSDKLKKYKRLWRKKRIELCPQFFIEDRLRSRLRGALFRNGLKKCNKTIDLIGCSISEFVSHIESQFKDGMGWHNRNLWHIDHIIPCSLFDLSDKLQQFICFHYSNLRPLWASENLRRPKLKLTT